MVTMNIKEESKKPHLLTGGHFACAGCGATIGIRLSLIALGNKTIMINPAGCMTLTATYPFTPYKIPWVHNAIENAAATGAGILMGLRAQGKDKGINIICYAGDGATYDIGLQSLSGVASRKEKIIFVCYNNCNYANTGHQRTSATQLYARTNTTPVGKFNKKGNILARKNMAKIMAMHNIPYSATASVSHPFDYINKLKKASKVQGPSFIDLLSPCEPGWIVDSDKTVEAAKKMVEAGMWPLYEIENKKVTINLEPPTIPVGEAIKIQGRFKHLTKNEINEIQTIVNKEWSMIKQGKFWESEEY